MFKLGIVGKTLGLSSVDYIEDYSETKENENIDVSESACSTEISYVSESVCSTENSSELSPRQRRNCATLKPAERLIETMLAEMDEPKNYTEAVNSTESLHWKVAMKEEIDSLKENTI